jgi:hypothetical protein
LLIGWKIKMDKQLEQDIIYRHLVQQILDQLPICSDVQSHIISYISNPFQLCKLLSYKLIRLGNVRNPIALVRKSIQIDKCKALVKSFDSVWDLFSTFLVKIEDKDIIEYWYNRCKI